MLVRQRGERFVVVDEFLPPDVLAGVRELMWRAGTHEVDSVVSPEHDGRARRSNGARFVDGLVEAEGPGRPPVYQKIVRMITSEERVYGRRGVDWDSVTFTFWGYPAGSRLNWHNDAGLGRTGEWWGVHHSGVVPDIVTIGKAFGGGFPLSGLLTTDEISQARSWGNPSGSSSSYGGNPLGAAAGAAVLKIIDEEDLVENARVVGGALKRELEAFVERYPFVGFVDGAGLLIRMELVKDKKTKEPLPRRVTERIFTEAVKRGLLTMAYAASFRIQPALTIDESTAKNGVEILREVFDVVERERIWQS